MLLKYLLIIHEKGIINSDDDIYVVEYYILMFN